MLTDKLKMKQQDYYSTGPVTLAFLGDSVTHGCFELTPRQPDSFNVAFDFQAVYHNRIKEMLAVLYPDVPVTIVNAGISGGNAPGGLKRLEQDVLRYSPDMTVVCFGLNDAYQGADKVSLYTDALREIFTKLRAAGSEVIFMTPNMIGQRCHERITNPVFARVAAEMCTPAHSADVDLYVEHARALCVQEGVAVCDCYAIWKQMETAGVDITSMLSNDINHPLRELHYIFAYELVKLMLTRF